MRHTHPCFVAPSPEVLKAIRAQRRTFGAHLAGLTPSASAEFLAEHLGLPQYRPQHSGYNDGAFYPPAPPHGGPALAPAAAHQAPPAVGKKRALVLLVDFPDLKGTAPPDHFKQLLFGDAGGTGPAVTMKSYYLAASYGQLTVEGDVFGWFTMPNPLTFYTNGESATGDYPQNGQRLVEHALEAAQKAGVDFSAFDVDGDGTLDGLIVVHAGGGAEAETSAVKRKDMVWSHKWTIPDPEKINGVTAWAYTLQPEDGRVGVFAHEFGHFLGLPDLYDTSNRSEGVGVWCVMGAGSWAGGGDHPSNMSAWCRARLGWLTPKVVTGTHAQQVLRPSHLDRGVIRLPIPGSTKEYFLLESRQKAGLDAGLPAGGLLVWHIDDARESTGNSDPQHYQVGLIEADANNDLEFGTNRGDAGDPFPGTSENARLDDNTMPSARTYAHKPTRIVVSEIQYTASTGVVICNLQTGTSPTHVSDGAGAGHDTASPP